ncbi:Conserved oligomeric Golgi complex subunit 6 [Neolecta irregularis DAH-3]|uniref:Conserved oligomeric Golgi complex subunit 6 n=1 Tax=Neolecta irregularis (strain DAH-3) TaxID=1198029 RepID=A0A1U7LHS2_NEOID|nr:Conserved oligomeric Golgi complex subunit 6 [Neolecta irregularis DAH-3]|eukprot:OLL22178.1 Conserved oligomeric Golgi complex subunit 6 [Neolecta irregularis DAH-3]
MELQAGSSMLSSKVGRIMSSQYTDQDMRVALKELDPDLVGDDLEAKRKLWRSFVGTLRIESNRALLEEFGKIADQVQFVGQIVHQLQYSCQSMRRQLALTSHDANRILRQADILKEREELVNTKIDILSHFEQKFTVSEEQLLILMSSSEPVDEKFFQAFAHVKKIHQDCQILLVDEQRIGLEIMEQSTKYLDAAFQKLYHWVQRELKSVFLGGHEADKDLKRAITTLSERDLLFENCLETLSTSRQKILQSTFLHALLHGDPTTATRPIEMTTHDPVRYIGDMLAWFHQSTAGEKEILESVIALEAIEQIPLLEEDPSISTKMNVQRYMLRLVDRNLMGLAKPFSSRFEHTVNTTFEPQTLFSIITLVQFYNYTMTKTLGPGSIIVGLLNRYEELASQRYFSMITHDVQILGANPPKITAILSPPNFLIDALATLRTNLQAIQRSPKLEEDQEKSAKRLLHGALLPFLDVCSQMAQELSGGSLAIYKLNCLQLTQDTLKDFKFTTFHLDQLIQEIQEHTDTLVELEHKYLLESSGLEPHLIALENKTSSASII